MGGRDASKIRTFPTCPNQFLSHSSCLCGHRSILAKKCTWITMLSLRCLFYCVILSWLQSNCGKSPQRIFSLNDVSYFSVLRTARLASPVHHCGNSSTFQLPKLFQSHSAWPGFTLTVRPLFQASSSPTILMRGFCYQSCCWNKMKRTSGKNEQGHISKWAAFKTLTTFHYTGSSTGIFIMASSNHQYDWVVTGSILPI